MKQLYTRPIFYFFWIMLLFIGCGKDPVPTAGKETGQRPGLAKLTVAVGGVQPLVAGVLPKPVTTIPDSITSVNLKILRGEIVLYSNCKDVTPSGIVTFSSIQVEAGQNTDFQGEAFSQSSCVGDLIYQGSSEGITLLAGDNPTVQINLSLLNVTSPDVTTDTARNTESTCVELSATINPNGYETVAWFEWGVDFSHESQTPTKQMGNGIVSVPLTDNICGLELATQYHFRAVASNGGNVVNGTDLFFITSNGENQPGVPIGFPGVPTVTTEAAADMSARGATLHGTVNPEGADSQVYFEWGTSPSYGNRTPFQALENGFDDASISEILTRLAPETEYHFRVVAFNAFGTTTGQDQLFQTMVPDQSTFFYDNFENGLANWTVSGSDWGLIDTDSVSTSHSMTDSPVENYLPSANAALTMTKVIDLSATTSPVLVFWEKRALPDCDVDVFGREASRDHGRVEISDDGGISWTVLLDIRCSITSSWFQTVIDLSTHKTALTKIRFRLSADGDTRVGDGWFIDDVEIKENNTTTSAFPFSDDFESGLGNWTVSGSDWGLIDTDSVSTSHSVTDSPVENYLPSANAALTMTKVIDLSATTSPVLVFWEKRALPDCDVDVFGREASRDHGRVEISDDGGISWTVLLDIRCSITSSWFQTVIDLSTHKTALAKIRFRLSADGDTRVGDGWSIDDVEIREIS